MTVTEPLATESGLESMVVDELAVEEVTLDLTASGISAPIDAEEEQTLWRDPLLPFLVLGTLSLIAVVISAFVLSSGAFSL